MTESHSLSSTIDIAIHQQPVNSRGCGEAGRVDFASMLSVANVHGGTHLIHNGDQLRRKKRNRGRKKLTRMRGGRLLTGGARVDLRWIGQFYQSSIVFDFHFDDTA